jgi:hypothetical protein
MPIVPILIGIALVVGAIALAMSGTTWRWYHITLTSLIMVFSVVWFYLAARTLMIEKAWRTEIEGPLDPPRVNNYFELAVHKADDYHNQLVRGYTEEGKEHLPLDVLKTEVEKLLQGRGRIWGGLRKTVNADGKITVTLPEGSLPPEVKTILWGFDEASVAPKLEQGGQFVGEFEVTAVHGQDVDLAPVLRLRAAELQRMAGKRGTGVVLYEVMPSDTPDLLKLARDAFGEQVEKLDDKALANGLFADVVPANVKQEFAKDGKPPEAGDADASHTWQRVKAKADFYFPVTAEEAKKAEAEGQPLESDPDTQKPAIKIVQDTILVLDPKSADEQIKAGHVEPAPTEPPNESDKIYHRMPRDYAKLYRDLNLRIEELLRATATTERQNAAVLDGLAKVKQNTDDRTKEKGKLQRDLAHYQEEEQMIKAHVAALEKEVAETRGEIQRVLASNRDLDTQLTTLMHELADAINRRAPLEARN